MQIKNLYRNQEFIQECLPRLLVTLLILSPSINPFSLAAYLKTAEGLEGEAGGGVHGTELWALAVGATVAILLLLVLLALLCFAHR